MLAFLVRHQGRTCTHQMILRAVWGQGYGEEARYVHAYVHRLRVKLGDEAGELVETVPGRRLPLERATPKPRQPTRAVLTLSR